MASLSRHVLNREGYRNSPGLSLNSGKNDAAIGCPRGSSQNQAESLYYFNTRVLARVGSTPLETSHLVWSESHRREFQQNNLEISLHQPLPLGSDPASLLQTLYEMTPKTVGCIPNADQASLLFVS